MSATLHEQPRLGARGLRFGYLALALGVIAVLAGLFLGRAQDDGFRRFQHAWLFACMFFLSLSLGALFFVIIQHLTRAAWSVVVRRVAELLAANTLILALLFAPLVVMALRGDSGLYPWVDAQALAADPLLDGKAGFLEPRFFAVRCLVYFGAWSLIGRWLLRRSLEQDSAADASATLKLERRSALALIAFALTTNFAAFDLLMTLDPAWFSTIFGVYFFSGSVMAFFAAMIVLLRLLQASGMLDKSVSVEHYHDLGKFLFAFVFFWSYIAFSQYMLIWYADLPEETAWFRERQHGSWALVSLILLAGHFALPFAGLLSRHAKRKLWLLSFWAVWLLCMHAVDLFWLVMPSVEHQGALVRTLDAACLVGVGGIWLFCLTRLAAKAALIPVNDPRLSQSLAFENM